MAQGDERNANPLTIQRTHHVEFFVGNAKQAAYYYRRAFGFSVIAYSGLETGNRDRTSYVLAQGKIRARFHRSMSKPRLLNINKVYKYKIDLWQTGITIANGARLQVEIASAAFPFFSRNLNTGGHNEMETKYVKATQTIHHSRRYPSHILLPRIPTARVNKAAARPSKVRP